MQLVVCDVGKRFVCSLFGLLCSARLSQRKARRKDQAAFRSIRKGMCMCVCVCVCVGVCVV